MAKTVIVVEFEQGTMDEVQEVLSQIKPIFADKEEVHVYGAMHETAETIVDILKLGA